MRIRGGARWKFVVDNPEPAALRPAGVEKKPRVSDESGSTG